MFLVFLFVPLLTLLRPRFRGHNQALRKKSQMRWTFSRYRRLFWDCGRKIGRHRIWTLRQAASAVNVWGIAYRHFPRQDRYRDDDSYPNSGWQSRFDLIQAIRLLPGELQVASLVNAAADIETTNAPICITDPEAELLSNRQ